jgi:hypothetical protein
MRGAPVSLPGPHILADNGTIHDAMLAVFADVFRGNDRFRIPEIQG